MKTTSAVSTRVKLMSPPTQARNLRIRFQLWNTRSWVVTMVDSARKAAARSRGSLGICPNARRGDLATPALEFTRWIDITSTSDQRLLGDADDARHQSTSWRRGTCASPRGCPCWAAAGDIQCRRARSAQKDFPYVLPLSEQSVQLWNREEQSWNALGDNVCEEKSKITRATFETVQFLVRFEQ